ncbi:MAG: Hpt domain-containing protein, partial [Polyangiales bacterium]
MSDQVTGPGAIDQEIVGVFLDESEELLADVDVQLIALESQPDDTEALNAVFRAFHSIKGNSAFFGLMRLKNLAHRLEDVLSLMREGRMCVTTEVMDTLLCGVDELRAMLSRIRDGAIECPVSCEHKHASLIEKLLTLCSAPHVSSLHPDVHASGATAGAVKGQVET